jgi:hypothetical protein
MVIHTTALHDVVPWIPHPMRASTGSRVFVISVRIVVRTSVRVVRTCRPWVVRAAQVVVALATEQIGEAPTALAHYTRYAVLGGVTASALALARSFSGPGASEVLAVVGILSVGALAVWIAIRLCREAQPNTGWDLSLRTRALIVATTGRIGSSHAALPLSRTLELLCEPRRILVIGLDPALLGGLFQGSLKKLVVKHAVKAVPGLSVAREAAEVLGTGLSHARFLHEFEMSARELCAARAA